jgi:hypothetical protein
VYLLRASTFSQETSMTEGYNPFPGFFVADTICSLQNADTSGLEDGCLAYVRANQSYYAYGASFAHAPAPNGTTVLSTFNGPAAVQADGSPCTGEQSHAHTAGGPGRWILTTLGYGGFQAPFKARAVQSLAVAHLNAASTSADGVTLLEGDVVLLTAQTPGTDNGPYVVGPVVGPAAPLTRPFWWSPDTVIPSAAKARSSRTARGRSRAPRSSSRRAAPACSRRTSATRALSEPAICSSTEAEPRATTTSAST